MPWLTPTVLAIDLASQRRIVWNGSTMQGSKPIGQFPDFGGNLFLLKQTTARVRGEGSRNLKTDHHLMT